MCVCVCVNACVYTLAHRVSGKNFVDQCKRISILEVFIMYISLCSVWQHFAENCVKVKIVITWYTTLMIIICF